MWRHLLSPQYIYNSYQAATSPFTPIAEVDIDVFIFIGALRDNSVKLSMVQTKHKFV